MPRMYAQWTLCRVHSYATKNTLLEGKQCNGTLKWKDTSFLNNVTLSLCFSYPNALYMTSSKVFLYHVTIFRKGPMRDSMGTLIRQVLWIGILKRQWKFPSWKFIIVKITVWKDRSLWNVKVTMAGCPENWIR